MEKEKNMKQKKVKYRTAEQDEMLKFLGVIAVVVVCVALLYVLTRVFVTKDLFNKEETKTEETVQGSVNYSVASVGQILNRPYDEYYVFVYDTTGDYATDMNSLLTKYNSKEKKLHAYKVDLSNYLNKEYYKPKEVNEKASTVADFKFGDITLIKVKNGKIDKYLTDYSKMQTELAIASK